MTMCNECNSVAAWRITYLADIDDEDGMFERVPCNLIVCDLHMHSETARLAKDEAIHELTIRKLSDPIVWVGIEPHVQEWVDTWLNPSK